MKKKIINFCICVAVIFAAAFFLVTKTVSHVSAYSYNSNVLTNPTPSNASGWTLTRAEWHDGSYGGEFKGTTNDAMYAKQTFTFSDRDIYRMNNGEIKIDASAYFWAQSSCTMKAYLQTEFQNQYGTKINSKIVNYDKYKVSAHNEKISFSDHTVPAGTKYIIYEAKNDDSLSGYNPSMRNFVLSVKDLTAPTYIATTPVTTPAKYKVGTKIRYQVLFTEPVNVISQGYVKFKVGTQEFGTNSTYAGQSSDGTTLYYDITLPSTTTLGDNLPVTITGLSGIAVTDDAGNSCSTIPAALSLSNGFYVDNRPPEVSNLITSASTNALYKAGESLTFDVTFHENIWVNGTPKINLSNGKSAGYVRKTTSDTNIASFSYTIADGDDVKNIAISSVDFGGIYDSVSNNATSAANYSSNAYNSFMNNKYVSIDTTAPTTAFSAAPGGWQKAYDVILSPADNISGVNEIYTAWTAIGGTPTYPAASNVDTNTNKVILPAKSGSYELHTKIVDKVGNTGMQKSPYTYYFDFDAPTIDANATKISGTDMVSSVSAQATDTHSGLYSFTYSWVNEKGITLLTGNASEGVSIPSADGAYTLNLTATDKIGNTSSKTIENLVVDSVAPVIAFEQTEGINYKQSYTVKFTVTDEKSGLDVYYYSFNTSAEKPASDSSEWIAANTLSLTTPNGVSGTYYLHIKAVDKVGNISISSTDGFNIDNAAPDISINQNGNAGIIGKLSYDIVISISDEITLYDELTKKYAVSDSETCPELLTDMINNTITIENSDKTKYLYIVAEDTAGNKIVFKSNPFISDTASPAGKITKVSNAYYINGNAATVNIEAVDDYSSDIYMQIKIDDLEEDWEGLEEQKTVLFSKIEGEHIISVRFKDVCGNISQYSSVTYYYDITPPQIDLVYSTQSLTNKTVTVTASAKDNASGAIFLTADQKLFNENGSFEFIVSDAAGNKKTITAKVDNIDITNPAAAFESAAFDGKKHRSAAVKINASDANGIKEIKYAVAKSGDTVSGYLPCSNGQSIEISGLDGIYKVHAVVVDNAGNSIEVSSQNIYFDNTPSIATIEYTPNTRTAQNVIALISFNEDTIITNNGSLNNYTFTENGSFTFEFKDSAGNIGSLAATVTWIDRSIPEAKIVFENEKGDILGRDEWSNTDIKVSVIPQLNSIIEDVVFNNIPVTVSEAVYSFGNNQYKISEYGRLKYSVKDTVTQITGDGEALIKVDKIAPAVVNIVYSSTTWTNQNVTVTINGIDDLGTVSYLNDSSHTFTENGSYEFIIEDNAKNRTSQIVTVDWIDKAVPIASVTYYVDGAVYDIKKPINKNIVAKVAFIEEGSPVSVTNNSGSTEYEFSSNGSFTFLFADAAGNESSITAAVKNIDKVAPIGFVTYSHTGWTNSDVAATLVAEDDVNDIIILNNPSSVYTFSENGSFTFEFMDSAGNTGTAAAKASRIDKIPPKLSYKLSTEEITSFPVYVFIEADEPVTIENNNGKTSRQFNSNGEFTFISRDRAGNKGEITVDVTNISRQTTPVVLTYSVTDPTNEDVYVKIAPKDGYSQIYVTNNNGQKIKKFTENGEFVFTYKNAAGIEGEAGASVSNIDKTPLNVSVKYSHENVTKDNVIATLTADEEAIYPYIIVDGKYIFTENMKLYIPVKDKVGNITNVTIETNLIDKTKPLITIDKPYEVLALGTEFDANSGVKVTDDTELEGNLEISGSYDINTAGDCVIIYTARDKAGNISTKEKYLTVYNPDEFNVKVNGRMASQGQITLDSRDIVIETINSSGSVKVKMLSGKKNTGDFKTKGEFIDLSGQLPGEGYYTLYITDEERNSMLVYIFIAE